MRDRKIIFTVFSLALSLGACIDDGDDDGSIRGQIGEPATSSRVDLADPAAPEQGDLSFAMNYAVTDDLLCKSCTRSLDCGGTGNYCLIRSDGARFCGRDCRTTACPSGYTCMTLGASIMQCVPPRADCTRVTSPPSADAGTTDAGTTDAGAPTTGSTGDVPSTTRCAAVATWDATAASFEQQVLTLTNQRRQAGATCGATPYPAVAPLTMSPALRCAARLHAKDMASRSYFSHTTPEGVTFSQRITSAGYDWRTVGENIASGYPTPDAVVSGWMQSAGHCQNIMNGAFRDLGVGYFSGYWVQDFGATF